MLWVCKDPEAGQRAERGALQSRPRDEWPPVDRACRPPGPGGDWLCHRQSSGRPLQVFRQKNDGLTYNVL